jgi:hypothetical protein
MAQLWTITSQRQTTMLTSAGIFEPVMEIRFQTRGGTSGIENVPLSRYTEQYVQDLLDGRATTIDSIANL